MSTKRLRISGFVMSILMVPSIAYGQSTPLKTYQLDNTQGCAIDNEDAISDSEIVQPIPPDELKIAFTFDGDGNPNDDGSTQIYLLDEGQLRNLTKDCAVNHDPSWSPDGRHLAYVSNSDGDFDIYILDVDGVDATKHIDLPGAQFGPAWSPDGKQLVYVTFQDGDSDVYTIEPDGSNEKLVFDSPRHEWTPAWSPDGKNIGFVSNRDGDFSLYTLNLADLTIEKLKSTESSGWFAWSPDGDQIVFQSAQDGDPEIYLIDVNGADDPLQLTDNSVEDDRPDWSPDGTSIIFCSNRDGIYKIYTMSLDESNPFVESEALVGCHPRFAPKSE